MTAYNPLKTRLSIIRRAELTSFDADPEVVGGAHAARVPLFNPCVTRSADLLAASDAELNGFVASHVARSSCRVHQGTRFYRPFRERYTRHCGNC